MKTIVKAAGAALVIVGVFSVTAIAFALLMQAPEGIASTFVHAFKFAEALAALAACISVALWLYRRRS